MLILSEAQKRERAETIPCCEGVHVEMIILHGNSGDFY